MIWNKHELENQIENKITFNWMIFFLSEGCKRQFTLCYHFPPHHQHEMFSFTFCCLPLLLNENISHRVSKPRCRANVFISVLRAWTSRYIPAILQFQHSRSFLLLLWIIRKRSSPKYNYKLVYFTILFTNYDKSLLISLCMPWGYFSSIPVM